ncbi:MAG: hypothetical protein ACOCX7_04935, partial [Bacteroidota bacterium]
SVVGDYDEEKKGLKFGFTEGELSQIDEKDLPHPLLGEDAEGDEEESEESVDYKGNINNN